MKRIGLLFVGFVLLTLFGCSQSSSSKTTALVQEVEHENYSTYVSKVPADKIQLYLFRGTNQCWTCITLGELTQKTLDEYFSEEVKSGKITYEDINAELPENQALA